MDKALLVPTATSTPETEKSASGESTTKKVYAQPILRKHGTFEATTHQISPPA